MATEKEIVMFQKATVYDILQILKQNPEKECSVEEMEKLLTAYVKGLEQ